MKKNFTLKSIFAILMLFCVISSYSQERTCGMVEYMEQQMQDPVFAKEYELNQKKFKARLQEMLSQEDFSQRGATIVIPVAVHFPTGNEADRDCLEALAQNQIDILNADYSGTNADISQWTSASANYPGINTGSANISFCIAVSNHPVGLDPELLEGNPAVTIGYNFGGGTETDPAWGGYMNFLIKPLGGGTLGFSPFPGSIAAGQAVTMNTFAFGSGAGCPGSGIVPGAPFNLGRTVTHELGHFYNLDHTFTGSCATDDGVADTPNIVNPTYGCPAAGSVAGCTATPSLTMSYMDYVDDACMYMFSAGQTTRVDAYVSGVLQSQLKPNVCTPASPGFNLTANNSPILSCPTTDTQAVFDLTFTTVSGFNESTTFSATGAPAGATVTFTPGSLSSDGNFTMTIGNLGATAQGVYTITVTGTSSPGNIVETVDVVLDNSCTEIVCDTYGSATGLNLSIPDGTGFTGTQPGTPLTHVINVPDSNTIEDIKINVDISHTYISDLLVLITHPDGTTIIDVWNGDCGSNDDFDVTFDDAGGVINCGSPTTGTFAPNTALSTFYGLDSQGDWTITIQDFFEQDTGVLNDWSIEICSLQSLSTEEFLVEDFSIFPNPNTGEFTVNLNSSSSNDITIDVFDIRGRRIFNNSYANTADFSEVVRLNNVQSGMYLVTVSDGDKKATKKIVVE
ncbi:T9SS type A sorting domain-containing protein [uncultured Psychroserpens sp.]|uniref:zinc-dependent metalloprotease n=1 Tax=uncultured Psychroserpens sp. TaxID=255436 RepID=UPI0026193D4D|nr:T9SS type A sorting domain-containing protein [uncultured Psychroserpens sp.]